MAYTPGFVFIRPTGTVDLFEVSYFEFPQAQRGTVTISGTDTSASVTFANPLSSASFFAWTTPVNSSGAVNANSRITYVSGRSTTGMTVNVHTAPGVGTSVTIAWVISL